MSMLRTNDMYRLPFIRDAAAVNAIALGGLLKKGGPAQAKSSCAKLRKRLEEVDSEMSTLCENMNDQGSLINWRTRKRIADDHLQTLDGSDDGSWSNPAKWDALAGAMGMVTSIITAAEQVIALNSLKAS